MKPFIRYLPWITWTLIFWCIAIGIHLQMPMHASGAGHWLFNGGNLPIAFDFFGFHFAGWLLASGHSVSDIYDIAIFQSLQTSATSYTGTAMMPYPPTALILFKALGYSTEPTALSLWFALGLGLYVCGMNSLLRYCGSGLNIGTLSILLGGTGVYLSILLGQPGLIITGLLASGIASVLKGKDEAGGILLITAAVIKPHVVIPVLVAMLFLCNRRTIVAAIITGAAWCAAATLLLGADSWLEWLHAIGSVHPDAESMSSAFTATVVCTVGSAMRLLGFSPEISGLMNTASGIAAAIATLAVMASCRKSSRCDLGWTTAVLSAPLVLPYFCIYDSVMFAVPVCILMLKNPTPVGTTIFTLLWVLPLAHLILGQRFELPLMQPLFIAAFTISVVTALALRRCRENNHDSDIFYRMI